MGSKQDKLSLSGFKSILGFPDGPWLEGWQAHWKYHLHSHCLSSYNGIQHSPILYCWLDLVTPLSMRGDSLLSIQDHWRGPSLFRSSRLPYPRISRSSANSERIFWEDCTFYIQAWYGNVGWVSHIAPLSIHILIHAAGAKFIAICFLHNLNITRPHFYHSVWEILAVFNDPPTALQELLELEVPEAGEQDPTRVGPVQFPWATNPVKSGWDLPLQEALRVFKNQVWFVCSPPSPPSPHLCYPEPIAKASIPETSPAGWDSSCSEGNKKIAWGRIQSNGVD